jgi:hypothetical protein
MLHFIVIARLRDRSSFYEDPFTYAASDTATTALSEVRNSASLFNPLSELIYLPARSNPTVSVPINHQEQDYPNQRDRHRCICPLGGYRYVPVETVEPGSDRSLKNGTNCFVCLQLSSSNTYTHRYHPTSKAPAYAEYKAPKRTSPHKSSLTKGVLIAPTAIQPSFASFAPQTEFHRPPCCVHTPFPHPCEVVSAHAEPIQAGVKLDDDDNDNSKHNGTQQPRMQTRRAARDRGHVTPRKWPPRSQTRSATYFRTNMRPPHDQQRPSPVHSTITKRAKRGPPRGPST